MLKNENIICISSIDWDFIWQGHQEIMSTYAETGNRVLFIENTGVRTPGIRDIPRIKKRIKNWFRGIKGIRKEKDNLYVFSPLALPFPYSKIAKRINRFLLLPGLKRWMKAMDFSDPIIWTFLPTPLSLDIANNLIEKILIYYCIDKFSASSISGKKIQKSEIKLLKKADLIFVTAKALFDYCVNYNVKVYNFPFAVNFQEFERIRLKKDTFLDEFQNIPRPIVGFVGGIHKWIDQNLIKAVAEKYLKYSFVFVGPLQADISLLTELENIHFLGHKKHEELPKYIKAFDVCIIPYLFTDYTKNVYPTKLNEYLAMGKPVVSSYLPEIVSFNQKFNNAIYIGKNIGEFGDYIKLAIKEDKEGLRERRIEIARENNWNNRIEKMSSLIDAEADRKKLDRETKWKENFLNIYRITRKRLIQVVFICFLAYFMLFYTPLFWLIAKPLKIVEAPGKADAIVVFAGGVGEAGSPGKSTIERARYSVELYEKGYSEIVIYSSGYTYKHNDASNMKLIALSLGIPEENIILEQKAGSTYENVKYTQQILREKGLNKILLVSSPYNMRRASLVFNHIVKDIEVVYTPVPAPQFFQRERRVKLEQIRAILHEYLGIIYYWWKGYI